MNEILDPREIYAGTPEDLDEFLKDFNDILDEEEEMTKTFDRGKETRAIARERVGRIPGRRVFVSKKDRQNRKRERGRYEED